MLIIFIYLIIFILIGNLLRNFSHNFNLIKINILIKEIYLKEFMSYIKDSIMNFLKTFYEFD